ncbi:MAG: sugar ABC transporter permease [Clostridiaceae bacterium]|nr:sugar ABC transporter permease [Clostridiaceae bacterium]
MLTNKSMTTRKKYQGVFYSLADNMKKNYDLYLLSLPMFIYIVVFHYGPMYGVQIAFKVFIPVKGINGSPWVGFEHFIRFFKSYHFWTLLKNTLGISIYSLAVGFPCPIILALMLNEVRHKYFKKTIQMVTYAPHFISVVVLVGIMTTFLSPNTGVINQFIKKLGMEPIAFLEKPEWFKTLYVLSGVWQRVGWNSIIYMAALSSIDVQLHEAAIVDGSNKLQRIYYIDIPGIIPTAVILLILNMGNIMSVGFEKVFLMQNPLNLRASEVISTYVYKVGLMGGEFSFSAAVGLFNTVVNFALLIIVNRIAGRVGDARLW